ncbi:MAG: hypothetical protein ACRC1L_05595, partial [Prochlorococcaceae cyanobacterium]
MVRLRFDGLPLLAAALPPLTLLALLMPAAVHSYELTEEPEASRSGLRWVADDQPSHRAITDQAVSAPEAIPVPRPPLPFSSHVATGDGLVWTGEDESTPLLAVDGERDSQQLLTDSPQTVRTGESPLADSPVVTPPPPVPAIASALPRATPSGLVWTAEDEPTPLVVFNPERDFPTSLTDTRRDLTQTTTAVVDDPQPPLPISSGLRWEMDDEFSALAAANPESSAVELLAAAASRIISVETVVEHLELASPQPGFSPEEIASLLLQAKSPDVTNISPSPADSANELIAIDSEIDAGAESKQDLIAMKPDLHSGSGSGQIVEIKLSSSQVTAPSGPVIRSDVQHYD